MRIFGGCFLLLLVAATVGCGPKADPIGPKVDAFTGKLVAGDQPVSFEGEQVKLQLVSQKNGETFGIPVKPDGTFTIGWMPIADYTAFLIREPKAAKGGPSRHAVPGAVKVVEGKTDYTIDLGKDFKP